MNLLLECVDKTEEAGGARSVKKDALYVIEPGTASGVTLNC